MDGRDAGKQKRQIVQRQSENEKEREGKRERKKMKLSRETEAVEADGRVVIKTLRNTLFIDIWVSA